ncbi:MAG: hypothetical protein COB02_13075 [Candidatus Cloacimonadota bacterium]|nr:MAG: hypothetical protein COB02_13075 [Candidatus Cloacimonadota bacterium]
MSETFYNLTNDILFKLTFGDPKKSKILICLINALLQLQDSEKIVEVEILNPFNDKEFTGDKLSIVDVKAKDSLGVLYNIEMQVQVPKDWEKRALYYASKLYTSQLKESQFYGRLNKTISISILNETCFQDNNQIHNIYSFHNTKSLKPLDNLMELHFIELSKFNKDKSRALSSPFEKWLYTLKYGDNYPKESDMLPHELVSEAGIKEAFDAMRYANADQQTRYLIEARQKFIRDHLSMKEDARQEGLKEGLKEGLEEGIKEGIEQGIEKVILNLIQNSTMNDLEISKLTSVDIKTISQYR